MPLVIVAVVVAHVAAAHVGARRRHAAERLLLGNVGAGNASVVTPPGASVVTEPSGNHAAGVSQEPVSAARYSREPEGGQLPGFRQSRAALGGGCRAGSGAPGPAAPWGGWCSAHGVGIMTVSPSMPTGISGHVGVHHDLVGRHHAQALVNRTAQQLNSACGALFTVTATTPSVAGVEPHAAAESSDVAHLIGVVAHQQAPAAPVTVVTTGVDGQRLPDGRSGCRAASAASCPRSSSR